MKLVNLLNPKLIQFNCDFTGKEEMINFLIDKAAKEYKLPVSADEVRRLVFEREALGGTASESGIALPHGRLLNFDDLVIAIGRPRNPIVSEGIPIKVFILLLTSKAGSQLYLPTLSCFARISRDHALFDKLLQCTTVHNFLGVLENIYVAKSLTIEDIMTTEIVSIHPEATLKTLTDLFYKHGLSYVPVVDGDKFIGEVTVSELLKVGLPNYAMLIGNLNFLSSFTPFENLLVNEEKILVKEIMRKPSIKLDRNTALIESALELTQNKRRHLPVVEGEQIIGIVSYHDIIKKVIRR